MFLCSNDKIFVASYADDSSICCFAKSPEKVITKLGWFLCPKLMFMDSKPRQSKVLKKSVSNVSKHGQDTFLSAVSPKVDVVFCERG